MKKIYLLTTEHLENGLWFRDEEDFKAAMNYVAIEAARYRDVAVLAFVLMSNHLHFVLQGHRERVISFINNLKHRYGIYYRRKYGVKHSLKRNGLDIRSIPYNDEAIEKAIAYVIMNPVAAGICAHPSQYPWGSGALYFSQAAQTGTPLSGLSIRALKRITRSDEESLPGEWHIGTDGYILPINYIDVKGVEAIYRRPQRMNYFLNNSSKAKKRLEYSDEKMPAFRDQSVLAALPDLCRSLFQKEHFYQLQAQEKSEFARQIRFRFSADATQIARVCGVTYEEAAHLLDSL